MTFKLAGDSSPVVETLESTVGASLKVELTELADVTDWSLLEVSTDSAVSYSRRANSLYFKAAVAGDYQIIIGYDGSPVRSFKLQVSN
ncbi:hypothetical protein [Escherichia phage RDN8.1]|nr:hypothetical protein [Escherichia phage RDN8.1]